MCIRDSRSGYGSVGGQKDSNFVTDLKRSWFIGRSVPVLNEGRFVCRMYDQELIDLSLIHIYRGRLWLLFWRFCGVRLGYAKGMREHGYTDAGMEL